VTLYSAIPVRDGERVVGAVLVSQSTSRILSELIEVRLDIFRTFLASVAVAVVLTLVFSATIARPLARLRLQALAIVDRRGRLKGRFEGSRRRDEIGDLARALEALSRRVEGHQGKLEAFASDVAHELKNPLASIRNATELLAEVDDPAARRRFRAMVEKDVARMEHVLSEVRELALLDAGQGAGTPVVDLRRMTAEVVEGYRLRGDTNALELDQGTEPVPVAAHPEHLTQVMTNLLDNALSFAPTGSAVAVAVGRDAGGAWLAVADAGPGVAPAERERIFDRFYSARPEGSNGHLGLGLAIVHAIASSYGGDVTCDAGGGGGARFTVRLPLA
jgi:two-component system sensor histidine kinase ChvG